MVIPYTFRPENHFQPSNLRKGADSARNAEGSIAEMRAYLATGIDAFFTDDPALGRQRWMGWARQGTDSPGSAGRWPATQGLPTKVHEVAGQRPVPPSPQPRGSSGRRNRITT